MQRRAFLSTVAAGAVAAALAGAAQAQTITLNGASQFNDDHAFTKAMVRFEELVKKYYGKPINFTLHKNSSLGLEKQYFEYMAQGKAVDYAIVSPAHMSTFSKAAPFIDAPFIFRDLDHWNKVLDADLLKPIADEINQKAEVMLIGYAGGGTRNIFVNKPVRNLQEMKGLKVRVQGAPIWSKTFSAIGMSPTVIAYDEIYAINYFGQKLLPYWKRNGRTILNTTLNVRMSSIGEGSAYATPMCPGARLAKKPGYKVRFRTTSDEQQ
jgi:TRAP-type C4-dicarboxylate transport system substrate-binding protein